MKNQKILTLADVLIFCSEYEREHQGNSISIKLPTKPWNAGANWREWPEYCSERGIYIFTLPDPSSHGIVDGTEIVCYIGKAEGKGDRPLAARIYSHFGRVRREDGLDFVDPPSPRHDWHESPAISNGLKQAVATRAVNVYSVAVTCIGDPGPSATDLEAFLLEKSKTCFGVKPPLNRQDQARSSAKSR
jgi:hypothetical protein